MGENSCLDAQEGKGITLDVPAGIGLTRVCVSAVCPKVSD